MLSRAKAQKAIEDGKVRVNDEVIRKASVRVQEGDKVSAVEQAFSPTDSQAGMPAPIDLHLPILYEDAACWVINKPAGIAVHPGTGMAPGEATILHGAAYLYKAKKLPFTSESVLVHRLDKETTGCLLVAKTPEAHLFLQKQFESRSVKKLYLALVAGVPEHPQATVDAPIGRNVSNRTQMTVYHTGGDAREARTTYKVLSAARNAALLECDLHTGRTHQIRVHLTSIGHPVLGDDSYTNTLSERLTQEYDIRSLCLHAWKLTFRSPVDQNDHAVIAPLPSSFLRAIEAVGIEWKP